MAEKEVKENIVVTEKAVFIGDFIFSYEGNLIQQYFKKKDALQGDVTEYEEKAMELMKQHNDFYGELNEVQYVTSESILSCSCGTHKSKMGVLKDHGVVRTDGKPVMLCNDCKDTNIYSFGICQCSKSAYETLPKRKEITMAVDSSTKSNLGKTLSGQKCIPLLPGEWQQKKGKIQVWDHDLNEYKPVLKENAILVCQYGGVITVDEVAGNEGSDQMVFKGQSWLELAEGNYPYIYSTKDPTYSQWTGGFNLTADLTFGIGHSIKTAYEFNAISTFVANHTVTEVAAEVQRYLQSDLADAVKQVNDFIKNNNVSLQQHQFDAVVCLVFNVPAALSISTDLGKELIQNSSSGAFNQQNIIDGFTYTIFQGNRLDGLVTRRNNELNLFMNADYINYYDSKQNVINAGIVYISY